MESVSYCQAERTKRRIAGCDREYDNAEKRDDASDRSEDVLAHDADGCCCQRSVSRLKAQVVNAHGAGSPYHRDEAFQDHHVVECHAALFLALHRTGDDRRLGGVESGEDAAGHRDEEDRDKVVLTEICTIQDAACIPVFPDLCEREAQSEDADKDADRGEQQDRTEYRIDASDDLVDREYGRDQIICEDHAVDHPCGNRVHGPVKPEYLGRGDIAGGVDEYRAYQKEQQAAEDLVYGVDTFVAVSADHVRHLCPAVAQADHAGEVVVHRTSDDIADRDGDKCDGSEEDALDRSEDRAGACDVQQVDQAVLPAPHRNVIDAVFFCVSRRLPVIRSEDVLAELSVKGGADEKDHETNDECNHVVVPPCLFCIIL